jgi:SAM-dependent methyltransferase
MTPGAVERRQDRLDSYFGERSAYWNDIYAEGGVQGVIYRKRMQAALAWIDALSLDKGAKVLEVGCGAGFATLELARRGYAVVSTDSSADMVALASHRIAEAGLGNAAVSVCDVHDLPYGTRALSSSSRSASYLGCIPRSARRVRSPGCLHPAVTRSSRRTTVYGSTGSWTRSRICYSCR